ncbi:MAG: hypothetical protein ACLPRH_08335, partial [Syntrophobacteraceae bacterium]
LNLTGSDIARRPAQRMRRRAEGDNIMARRAFADLRQRRCDVSARRDQSRLHFVKSACPASSSLRGLTAVRFRILPDKVAVK